MKVKIGSRWSIQRTIGLSNLAAMVRRPPSADSDDGVGNILVGRHFQVPRCRAPADASGGVVVRAVARAEPAAVVTAGVRRLLAERHAAEVGDRKSTRLNSSH